MAADQPLRIAILGCGAIARVHAKTLRRFPDVGLSFASRDPRRATGYAREFGGGRHDSYRAAMADAAVDAVMITTPPIDHARLTLDALSAGKHVLVEKPAFGSSLEAEQVLAASRAAARQVLVLENYHYKPLARLLRRLIADGEIGDLRLVRLNALKWQDRWGWRAEPDLAGGGALFEGGIHWINFLATLGPEVEAVEGLAPPTESGTEWAMVVVVRYRGGAIGTLHHAWDAPVLWKGLALSHLIGSKGTITFESNGLFVGLNGARRRRLFFPGFRDIRGFRAMFTDLVAALRTGSPPAMTLERARDDLRLVEAAYRSAGLPDREEAGWQLRT